MLKNYFKIAFRNLIRFKTYSFINIFGLAIGIASCIIILIFITDELSYDKFNEKADRIYRVHTRGKLLGNDLNMAVSPAPLGETLVNDFPEVIQSARLVYNANMLIRYNDNVFNETRFFWADSTIFDIFTMPFIKGNPETALNEPHTIVLTESLAEKYFGKEDPIDKIMNMEDGTPYTVRGVIKDCPSNAHFHYDLFASLSSWGGSERNTFWVSNNFHTYILLKEGVPAEELQKKLPEFVKKYAGPQLQQLLGITYDEARDRGYVYEFLMQPLLDIHLKSHLDYEIEPNSDIRYVYIFSIIAVFILLIACINFMNLTTARSSTRSREVGIRKVLGSSKTKLIKQFLTESVLLAFFAVIIAVVLVEILLPAFSQIAGKNLRTDYFNLSAIPALIITVIVVGFLAGIYPAFFLSSFQPVKVLKGSPNEGKRSLLRSGLVVFQFAITIILFICTFVVADQMKFIREKKLGFDKEHVLVIQRAWALEDHAEAFKDELLRNSEIVNVSNTDNLPGKLFGQTVFKPEDAPLSQQYPLAIMSSDYNFPQTLGLELAEGRFFSRQNITDSSAVILNENAVRFMELKDPVGKRIMLPDPEVNRFFTVIGVLKDFHYESLHQQIRPLAIFLNTGQTAYLPVRIRPGNLAGTISFIESQWKNFVPGKPFEYFFLDEDFDRLYQSEYKTGQIFTAFSILAIFIACLGLFGLTAFTVERRIKEIGIRKVLGASVSTIVFLVSKEFLKWVLIANIIAWPVAYYFMNNWLQNFAYRTDITVWVFIISGIIALVIALFTVSSQTLKAATANPVKSLRYE